MSKKKKDLSEYTTEGIPSAEGFRIGLVVSKWNEEITEALSEGCTETLLKHGVRKEDIHKVSVPGTFELPTGLRILANSQSFDAIVCIGCVIKGETKHNDYISSAVANGLTQFSLMTGIPAIFGVLTPDNWEQAKDRAGGKHGNKGIEAAVTAIQMAALKKQLGKSSHKIGFSI